MRPTISHLLFVDDYLHFIKVKASQLRLADNVLSEFCTTSGLKVNLEKSQNFASSCVQQQKQNIFFSICNIHFIRNLGKYLRFPLIFCYIKRIDFHYVVKKV